MRALPSRFLLVAVLAVIAAGAFPLTGGHAHAASLIPGHFHLSLFDDGVGPALTHVNSAACNVPQLNWQTDGGGSGFPNVQAEVTRSNGSTYCAQAIWNDHTFTVCRMVNVTVYISDSANAVITYGFFNTNNQRFATITFNQDPVLGWSAPLKNPNGTTFESNQIAYVQIADNDGNPCDGNEKCTWIGAAGIDFTQV